MFMCSFASLFLPFHRTLHSYSLPDFRILLFCVRSLFCSLVSSDNLAICDGHQKLFLKQQDLSCSVVITPLATTFSIVRNEKPSKICCISIVHYNLLLRMQ